MMVLDNVRQVECVPLVLADGSARAQPDGKPDYQKENFYVWSYSPT